MPVIVPPAAAARAARPLPALQAVQVGVVVAADLDETVADELLEERVGEHERDHRLAHDPRGGHGADVAALHHGLDRLLGGDVHRPERLAERGDGLHRGTDDHGLAVGHAALEAAGPVARPLEPALGVEQDLVVDGRARPARGAPAPAARPRPPPRLLPRLTPPSASNRVSSWTAEPGRRAVSKPSPNSQPLIAWIEQTACARRPASRGAPPTEGAGPT